MRIISRRCSRSSLGLRLHRPGGAPPASARRRAGSGRYSAEPPRARRRPAARASADARSGVLLGHVPRARDGAGHPPGGGPAIADTRGARLVQQHLALVPAAGDTAVDDVADFFMRRQLAVLGLPPELLDGKDKAPSRGRTLGKSASHRRAPGLPLLGRGHAGRVMRLETLLLRQHARRARRGAARCRRERRIVPVEADRRLGASPARPTRPSARARPRRLLTTSARAIYISFSRPSGAAPRASSSRANVSRPTRWRLRR